MDYKIRPDLFECPKNMDWSALKPDLIKPPTEPFTASSGENSLAKRVRIGASFDGLDIFTASRAKDIEQILALLIMRRSINPDNLERVVVDFGMGTGGGTYVLTQYGGTITGVDSSESCVQRAIEERILPKKRAFVQDGFEYLRGLQSESVELIAAFMMHHGFPHERLCQESQRVLKQDGQLLITGGRAELKDDLQRTVGKYGKVEDVITIHDDKIFGNVAFTYTKQLSPLEMVG